MKKLAPDAQNCMHRDGFAWLGSAMGFSVFSVIVMYYIK